MHSYYLYGIHLKSQWRLPFRAPHGNGSPLAEVEILGALEDLSPREFSETRLNPKGLNWFHHERLADGSFFLRWQALFEFQVSADGRRISGRPLAAATWEVFTTYLLGQVLSFALINQGFEPWHATTVVLQGGAAVALMGDCGYGKSSLAAALVRAGHRLLTDDLLLVKEMDGGFLAYAGPPRVKLFPEMARRLLGDEVQGIPLNNLTDKLIIPLPDRQYCPAPTPLQAIYVLRPPHSKSPRSRVTRRTLNKRQAVLALIANTYNMAVDESGRLSRQFHQATRLAEGLPLKSLSYPRDFDRLAEVAALIQRDCASGQTTMIS